MIVPMKKAELFALKQDRDALLLALQRVGEFMIIPTEEDAQPTGQEDAQQALQQAENALGFVSQFQEKKSFFAQRPELDLQSFLKEDPEALELEQEAKKIAEQLAAVRSERSTLAAQMEQLTPWLPLDIPLDRLAPTRYASFHTGSISAGAVDPVKQAVEEQGADLTLLAPGPEGFAALLTCLREEEHAVLEAAKAAGFVENTPPRVKGLAKDAYEAYHQQYREAQKLEEQLVAQAEELAGRKEKLELLYEQRKAQADRQAVSAWETAATFRLVGWVRSDRTEAVKKAVAEVTDACALSFTDPTEEDNPPTVTKNNWFVSQFETITDMFSRPTTREGIDPNPVMAPWYWLIFGLMMGDAGYGLVMAIAIFAFKKIKKPKGEFAKLINVLWYSSITTMSCGVLFGSYFGETWHPLLFSPLDAPVPMLIFSIIIGTLHIFSGMILKVVHDIKAGHFWDAMFDQVSWMVLITGLGLLFLPATAAVGKWMAIIGALVILCTAGRGNKGFGKVTGGFLGLYNITGYMSDILSYSRILALSLATGVIGMVMNLLAGMVQGSVIGFVFSLLIYLVGHVFNIAMGLLSAYVHDSRLQYIEFFSKCYEGGGYAFQPLSIDPKYIDVVTHRQSK